MYSKKQSIQGATHYGLHNMAGKKQDIGITLANSDAIWACPIFVQPENVEGQSLFSSWTQSLDSFDEQRLSLHIPRHAQQLAGFLVTAFDQHLGQAVLWFFSVD